LSARPLVLAHRGGALEAPENSVEAFERAIRLGYDGVELDVRCSKDGIPVVVHDEAAPWTPGAPPRPVAEGTAAELSALPRLDLVLGLPWGAMTLMVEVKPSPGEGELAAAVARALVGRGPANSVLASFSAAVLRAARQAAPRLPLLALVEADTDESAFDAATLFGWGVDRALLAPARVAAWKAGGRRLWVWTIDRIDQLAPALAAGADGVITDVPGAVRERLAAGRP
jgi:glycerophosphoryl diester phosphodiesterase